MANIQLAKNLKILREKQNLTQTQLGAMLNISRQAYSNYERAVREPDLTTLVCFAEFYHVTLDDLVLADMENLFIYETAPDYVLTENPESRRSLYMTEDELELVMRFRERSADDRRIISGFLGVGQEHCGRAVPGSSHTRNASAKQKTADSI